MFKRIMGVVLLAVAMPIAYAQATPAAKQQTPATASSKKAAGFDASGCFGCHAPVKEFHDSGKHKGLACTSCHSGIENHLGNPSTRPVTSTDPATCGACHKNQFDTAYQMDWQRTGRFEKKQMTGPSPNPSFDLLMTPHGFTREHNLPRSHAFMVLDQFVVDRGFGGRFSPKDSWRYLAKNGGNFKVWDVIQDNYPDNTDQKPFKPGTAAAANPVCISCKTQDHILEWAYMGDPVPGAKWSRSSKVVEMAKSVNHANNCIFCHDPHAAKPRVVRDALIQALTRKDFPTLYSEDPKQNQVRGQGHGCARLHAQDRDARELRQQAAVRAVPRRVQLQSGHRSEDGRGDRHGRPAHQRLPAGRCQQHHQVLRQHQLPRLPPLPDRRAADQDAAPGRRSVLEFEARQGGRAVPVVPHAEGDRSEDQEDLHVALADQSEALHQGDLPDLPHRLERASRPST